MLSFVCSFVCFSLTLFLADGYYTDKKKDKTYRGKGASCSKYTCHMIQQNCCCLRYILYDRFYLKL